MHITLYKGLLQFLQNMPGLREYSGTPCPGTTCPRNYLREQRVLGITRQARSIPMGQSSLGASSEPWVLRRTFWDVARHYKLYYKWKPLLDIFKALLKCPAKWNFLNRYFAQSLLAAADILPLRRTFDIFTGHVPRFRIRRILLSLGQVHSQRPECSQSRSGHLVTLFDRLLIFSWISWKITHLATSQIPHVTALSLFTLQTVIIVIIVIVITLQTVLCLCHCELCLVPLCLNPWTFLLTGFALLMVNPVGFAPQNLCLLEAEKSWD